MRRGQVRALATDHLEINMHSSLLFADNLTKTFGGIRALSDYSITLRKGELVGLIGPNGAGKTTVFNLLSGVLQPSAGNLFFNGKNITRFNAFKTARCGISRTFQNLRVFQDLSVIDNIMTGFHRREGRGFFSTILHLPGYVRSEARMRSKAGELAELLDLSEHLRKQAGSLSYGDQRRLEIARALATSPELLLLDEPAAGMNPQETIELAATIRRIHADFNLTILLIEHDMSLVMDICERLQVLNYGSLLAEGPPDDVRSNPEVVAAYLGSSEETLRGRAC